MTNIDNTNSITANPVQNAVIDSGVQSTSATRPPPFAAPESLPDSVSGAAAPTLSEPTHNASHAAAALGLDTMSQNVAYDFSMFSALLIQVNQESEKLARDQIVTNIQSVADTMEQAASDLEASAGLALASGVISGASSIAAGGLSIAGGIKTFKIISSGKPGMSEGATMLLSQKSQSVSLKVQGFSQGVTGLGQALSSAVKFGADYMQAQSKRTDATAERQRGELERGRQYADNIHRSTQTMQQALTEVEQMRSRASSEIMTAKV